MLLSTVLRLERERGQRFGAGQSIDILLGRKTDKVTQYHHDELTVFGIGTDLKEAEWRAVVRQLLAQGLLAVTGEYGVLSLTEASADVLARRRQVMLRRQPDRPARAAKAGRKATAATPAASPAFTELSPEAQLVFERLRGWRAATAQDQGVPAYVVFHDSTLRQIAADMPTSLEELRRISGVGEAKLARYGEPILGVLEAATAVGAAPSAGD